MTQDLIKKFDFSYYDDKVLSGVFLQTSLLRGLTFRQVQDQFLQELAKLKQDTEFNRSQIIRQLFLFQPTDPVTPQNIKFMAIDLETSQMNALDHIIEVGYLDFINGSVYGYGGLQRELIYSMPNLEQHPSEEIPWSELHHLYKSDLVDKEIFSELPDHHEIIQKLHQPPIMLAHNAFFEMSRFRESNRSLSQKIDAKNLRFLDSMLFSRHLDIYSNNPALYIGDKHNYFPNYISDNLNDYSHRWQILTPEQEEKHSAFDDAKIMLESFVLQLKTLHQEYGSNILDHWNTDLP